MTRRMSLPGADELFRATATTANQDAQDPPDAQEAEPLRAVPDVAEGVEPAAVPAGVRHTSGRRGARQAGERRPSGREWHDEKITVYVSAEELMDLEHARLTLRGEHGMAVDRGRIVREALAVVIEDLEAKGETSVLVQRLRGR